MTFFNWRADRALENWNDKNFRSDAFAWHDKSRAHDYQYMISACGLPIIQDPQDVCMLSELIWDYKPDVVIETGIARGGSIVHHAHNLAALNAIDHQDGLSPNRRVIGIDIDIREENKTALDRHPLSFMFDLIQGSSIDDNVVSKVGDKLKEDEKVMVILDSNHEESHVLVELEKYSKFVTKGMPLFVMDTGIEFAPAETFSEERPWRKGSNPYTAVQTFLKSHAGQAFSVKTDYQQRYIITSSPDGLLIRG